tara:strand:- start:308 stop:550 length:243 start_codon:yes stop_codon:yes gene_type:complete
MKNQETPANPVPHENISEMPTVCITESMGETKYEKAFWQVYSEMIKNCHPDTDNKHEFLHAARKATEAVNAGFEALENRK